MDGRAIDTIPEVAPVFAAFFGAGVFISVVFAIEGEAALLAAR